MSKPLRLTAATLAIAALAPATASAAWTAPTTIDTSVGSNPLAQSAFGGSVLTGWLEPTASLAKRSGDAFGAPTALTAADPFEKVWAGGLDRDGNAVVLTVRKHAPFQRIRATFVAADGTRSDTRTISTDPRSSAGPQLSVAPDGTAVAAWSWHDATGWRAPAWATQLSPKATQRLRVGPLPMHCGWPWRPTSRRLVHMRCWVWPGCICATTA